ncbi:MAG: hypothetical protein WCJ51_00665 [Candidatus Moraniibacteriota bacterium]
MKIVGIVLASMILAGAIVSPFFWLRFLKAKGVWKYLLASSVATLLLLVGYIFFAYDYFGKLTAKINADLYYFYDDFSVYPILIVFFLIIISPLIFVKIVWGKFSWKSLLTATFLSGAFFVAIFLWWALILLPHAFNQLHNYF